MIVPANNQEPMFWPVLTLSVLAMLVMAAPAFAQSVSTTETRRTPHETTSTPLSATERARSIAWGLSDTEWRRYQSLKLGIRGSVSTANLSPIEVLGIHARDSAERRAYAERWARAMHEDAERILAFQHAYDAAAKRLLSGQTLIDVGKLQTLPQKTSELQADDRILFFTAVMCPACDAVLVKLLSHLESVAGIDIYITDAPKEDDALIRAWAEGHGIRLEHIQPGKPQQNAYVERYNRTVRYDWLAQYMFDSIEEVQEHATHWLWTYNNERPNMALGGITPKQRLDKLLAA